MALRCVRAVSPSLIAAAGRLARWPAATCPSATCRRAPPTSGPHTYPLAAGGEVQIVNTNGRIEVEGVRRLDGRSPGRADRPRRDRRRRAQSCCRASPSTKTSRPTASSIETERLSGIMIGVELRSALSRARAEERARQRRQHQRRGHRRPRSTARSSRTRPTAASRHGTERRRRSARRPTAASRSSSRRSATDPIDCGRPTAASTLTLPATAKATVSASCTNGGISVGSTGNFEVSEQSRRHLEGRLNGGGTPIELHDDQRRHPAAIARLDQRADRHRCTTIRRPDESRQRELTSRGERRQGHPLSPAQAPGERRRRSRWSVLLLGGLLLTGCERRRCATRPNGAGASAPASGTPRPPSSSTSCC